MYQNFFFFLKQTRMIYFFPYWEIIVNCSLEANSITIHKLALQVEIMKRYLFCSATASVRGMSLRRQGSPSDPCKPVGKILASQLVKAL